MRGSITSDFCAIVASTSIASVQAKPSPTHTRLPPPTDPSRGHPRRSTSHASDRTSMVPARTADHDARPIDSSEQGAGRNVVSLPVIDSTKARAARPSTPADTAASTRPRCAPLAAVVPHPRAWAGGLRARESSSSCSRVSTSGDWLRRYQVHVSAFAVVSWPARSSVIASSRSWRSVIPPPVGLVVLRSDQHREQVAAIAADGAALRDHFVDQRSSRARAARARRSTGIGSRSIRPLEGQQVEPERLDHLGDRREAT